MAEPLLAGLLLGGVAAWVIHLAVGRITEWLAARRPKSDRGMKLSVIDDQVVLVAFSEPTLNVLMEPKFAMRFGMDLKRAAARCMEHPPAAGVEGT